MIDPKSIFNGLITSLIFLILCFTWGRTRIWLMRRLPTLSVVVFVGIIICWAYLYSLILYTMAKAQVAIFLMGLISSFLIGLLVLLLWKECGKYRLVGILGVDKKISTGLSYNKALVQCKSRIRFLGLGASKLTRSKEFADAMVRCTHDESIKFLLLRPNAERLMIAAQRANRDREEYKNLVIESLLQLRKMRVKRGVNIQVRFYDELPIFRLMFIDNMLCLVSYYVLGEGDGSQLPQLYLANNPLKKRTVDSFYYAFDAHFNRLWDHSEDWDFATYLKDEL